MTAQCIRYGKTSPDKGWFGDELCHWLPTEGPLALLSFSPYCDGIGAHLGPHGMFFQLQSPAFVHLLHAKWGAFPYGCHSPFIDLCERKSKYSNSLAIVQDVDTTTYIHLYACSCRDFIVKCRFWLSGLILYLDSMTWMAFELYAHWQEWQWQILQLLHLSLNRESGKCTNINHTCTSFAACCWT